MVQSNQDARDQEVYQRDNSALGLGILAAGVTAGGLFLASKGKAGNGMIEDMITPPPSKPPTMKEYAEKHRDLLEMNHAPVAPNQVTSGVNRDSLSGGGADIKSAQNIKEDAKKKNSTLTAADLRSAMDDVENEEMIKYRKPIGQKQYDEAIGPEEPKRTSDYLAELIKEKDPGSKVTGEDLRHKKEVTPDYISDDFHQGYNAPIGPREKVKPRSESVEDFVLSGRAKEESFYHTPGASNFPGDTREEIEKSMEMAIKFKEDGARELQQARDRYKNLTPDEEVRAKKAHDTLTKKHENYLTKNNFDPEEMIPIIHGGNSEAINAFLQGKHGYRTESILPNPDGTLSREGMMFHHSYPTSPYGMKENRPRYYAENTIPYSKDNAGQPAILMGYAPRKHLINNNSNSGGGDEFSLSVDNASHIQDARVISMADGEDYFKAQQIYKDEFYDPWKKDRVNKTSTPDQQQPSKADISHLNAQSSEINPNVKTTNLSQMLNDTPSFKVGDQLTVEEADNYRDYFETLSSFSERSIGKETGEATKKAVTTGYNVHETPVFKNGKLHKRGILDSTTYFDMDDLSKI